MYKYYFSLHSEKCVVSAGTTYKKAIAPCRYIIFQYRYNMGLILYWQIQLHKKVVLADTSYNIHF